MWSRAVVAGDPFCMVLGRSHTDQGRCRGVAVRVQRSIRNRETQTSRPTLYMMLPTMKTLVLSCCEHYCVPP